MKTIKKITIDGKYLEKRDPFELFSYSEFYNLLDLSIEIKGVCGIDHCINGNICLGGHDSYSKQLCMWVEAVFSRYPISPDSVYGRKRYIILHDGDDIEDYREENRFLYYIKTVFDSGDACHIYEILENEIGEFRY